MYQCMRTCISDRQSLMDAIEIFEFNLFLGIIALRVQYYALVDQLRSNIRIAVLKYGLNEAVSEHIYMLCCQVDALKELLHSPHEIISTVCDFPYKIIEKCFQ